MQLENIFGIYLFPHVTYNSFYSQLVRYASICSKFDDFADRCNKLKNNLVLRGFDIGKFGKYFWKFVVHYYDILKLKYNIDMMKRYRYDEKI